MTWWGDVIIWGSVALAWVTVWFNIWQTRKRTRQLHEIHMSIDDLVTRARLQGYRMGYHEGQHAGEREEG